MTQEELVHAETYLCRVLSQTFSHYNAHKRAALETARQCVRTMLVTRAFSKAESPKRDCPK